MKIVIYQTLPGKLTTWRGVLEDSIEFQENNFVINKTCEIK